MSSTIRGAGRTCQYARIDIAGVAFVLAVVGIAAVAHTVIVSRRREIGIRLALGEPTSRVTSRVMRQAAAAAAIGAVAGLLIGGHLPVELEPGPVPWWLPESAQLAVPVFAVLFAVAVSYVLCRRAVGADPAGLLREE